MTLIFAALLALSGPSATTETPQWMADVVERWAWTDLDVSVVSLECGGENAWYNSEFEVIVVCEELFDRPELASWVFAHELAHAFMFQHGVPQRLGTYDQERAADELAFLMSTPDENYAAASWFMSFSNVEWDDGVHPTPLARAGSLLCLQSARDGEGPTMCSLYYDSLLGHWVRIMEGYL